MSDKNITSSVKKDMKTRKFKMGGYSLIVTVLFVAVVIILNIGVSKLPVSMIQKDITSDKVYEISDLSKSIAEKLDEEVIIYWIVTEGKEDVNLQHFLERYDELSGYIKIERVDPTQYSKFVNDIAMAENLDTVTDNSLYIVCAERARFIKRDMLYSKDYVDGYGSDVELYFYGDSCITSALDYVAFGTSANMYILNGHGEGIMSSDYVQAIEKLNINIKDLSIVTEGTIPEDADILFLCAPEGDISREEEALIFDFLKKGGKLMAVTYPTDGDEHHNIEELMNYYGVTAVRGYVMEGDSSLIAGNTPAVMITGYTDHKIVEPIANAGYYVMLFAPQGLVVNSDLRDTLSVTPLLISSPSAYIKSKMTNSYDKKDGDITGQFAYAVAIDETVDGVNSKIVWVASDAILDDNMNEMVSGGNQEVLLNSLSYLTQGEDGNLAIHPKNLKYEYLFFNGSQGTILSIIVIGVIPLIYGCIGLVIYFKRKKK